MRRENVQGPVQVNNAIIRTPAISTAITLLNQQGSSIIQGSMQLIPVGDTISTCAVLRAGRGSGRTRIPVRGGVLAGPGAFCAPTVEDALQQLTGQASTVTTCSVSNGASSAARQRLAVHTTTTTRHRHHRPRTTVRRPRAARRPHHPGGAEVRPGQAALKTGDFTPTRR